MRFVDNVACARETQITSGASLSIATNTHLARASDNADKSPGHGQSGPMSDVPR